MSIEDEIEACKRAGRLMPLMPLAPGTSAQRALLATVSVYQQVTGPWDSEADETRFMALRADLDVFSAGRLITPRYLFQLRDRREEVWEIRSLKPLPSIRIFGRFAAKDAFVAINYERREVLADVKEEWRRAKETCKAEWRKLFLT